MRRTRSRFSSTSRGPCSTVTIGMHPLHRYLPRRPRRSSFPQRSAFVMALGREQDRAEHIAAAALGRVAEVRDDRGPQAGDQLVALGVGEPDRMLAVADLVA